jgi:hypothetical protein
VRHFLEENHETLYTTNQKGKLTGVITSASLRHLIIDFQSLRGMVIAKDIAEPVATIIDAEDSLEDVMGIFSHRRVEEIPVMENRDTSQIIGVLHYQDVIKLFNKSVAKNSFKKSLAGELVNLRREEILEVMPGFSLAEVPLPEGFIDKTPLQLKLRNDFKIDLLMIERRSFDHEDEPKRLFPDKNFIFRRGDKLVIYGQTTDIITFKALFNL